MTGKRILIAGLPDAGKTTYIAALNGVMSQDGDFSLQLDGKASQWTYVNDMTNKWLEGETVTHSTDEEAKFIKWPLKNKDGQRIDLTIPDMKGEYYYDIINNDFDPKLAKFCEEADGILYFINGMSRFVLKEHFMNMQNDRNGEYADADDGANKEIDETKQREEADKIKLKPENMQDVTKNLLVIKYLRELMGDVKIVVAISSWDERKGYNSIDDYFKQMCPAIYNYVTKNFSNSMLCGVSAQGVKYGSEDSAKLNELTEKGKRAYIFTDEKKFDLALPLQYLID